MNQNKNIKAVKAGIWYTIVNFISKGAVFLTTPIFTRIMTAGDIGSYANITSWFQILVPLITFDMYVSLNVARFDYKEELDRYISSVLLYGSTITGLFYVIVVINMDFFCRVFSMSPYAIHIIFVYMLVYPAMQMLQQKNLFEFRYKFSAFITLTSLILSIGLALLLTIVMEDKLKGRLIGYYMPLILTNIIIYIVFLIKGKVGSIEYFKYALSISFPMIWHSMATQLLSAGDRVLITYYCGDVSNAFYSVAYTSSMVVTVLWSSMNSAWSPWSIEKMDSGDTSGLKKASRPYIVVFSIVVAGMILVAPELLWIMGGVDYVQAKYCLPPIMVGLVCQFIYSLYINAEFYLKKQVRIAVGTIGASLLNVILNLIFIPMYGYVAAAYTTLIGYIALLLFHYLSLKLIGKEYWYDNRFNMMIVIAFLFSIPITLLLYKIYVLRYIAILVFSVVTIMILYKERKMLFKYIRKFIH